jgi:TPR repeat protein
MCIHFIQVTHILKYLVESVQQDGRPGLVAKDKIKALDWYGRSALAGNDYAKDRLSVLLNGKSEAVLFVKALGGDMDAAFEIGQKYDCELVSPYDRFDHLSELNDRSVRLRRWEAGESGFPQSFDKAIEMYEKASSGTFVSSACASTASLPSNSDSTALRKHPGAAHALGRIYESGRVLGIFDV